jgi:UDP-glucose 4-epimerase
MPRVPVTDPKCLVRGCRVNILITGGAGFIGSFLAERLIGEGHRVRVLDDLSTGSLENLRAISSDSALEFREGSVMDSAVLDDVMKSVDCVFHLASAVGVELIMEQPSASLLTNIVGTERVLAACLKNNTRVFLASTSEVYGKSFSFPQRETDDLILGNTQNLRWSYACGKICDEFLALAYVRERSLPATIVRFFNTTGPRQSSRYGMVIPKFIDAAMAGKPLKVHGTGEQSRCFCHVADTVEALVRLMTVPNTAGEVFNIGNDKEITISDLAKKVVVQIGSGSSIDYVPYKEAYGAGFEDMQRRVPELSKIEIATGFRPQTPLETIIDDIHRERLEARNRDLGDTPLRAGKLRA